MTYDFVYQNNTIVLEETRSDLFQFTKTTNRLPYEAVTNKDKWQNLSSLCLRDKTHLSPILQLFANNQDFR